MNKAHALMFYNDTPKFDLLFGQPYDERAQESINDLDSNALATIRNKKLEDLNEDDLTIIGFLKQNDPEYEELYAIKNLDDLKLYLTIENGHFLFRGYQLMLIKEITSIEELINEALITWKLKMN